MSSGQKPRNPYYFPKMKVRGARRKRLAVWQLLAGAADSAGEAFRKFTEVMERTLNEIAGKEKNDE